MIVYKLLYYDEMNTLRSDPSYRLRSAAVNLPDWLVEWYKENQVTEMRFPDMPLWACDNLFLAHQMRSYGGGLGGHYEIWECEAEFYEGHPFCLSGEGMYWLKRNADKYDLDTVKEAEFVGEMGWPNGTVFCKSIKPIRRIK